MTRKQESFLNDLHRLFKEYNITDMYPMTSTINFVSNNHILAVGGYDNDSRKPRFREVVSDYTPEDGDSEAYIFHEDEIFAVRKIEEDED